MQDLGLVAGTSESSGSLYQMSSTTGANPRPIQPEPASGEMATENWTCWPFPAGHLGQSGPGPHRKWALHLPNRSRQTGMAALLWTNPCLPWFQWETEGCVSSAEASGPRCYRTNQSFLGLAVYVFVFRGHTQVSDPLTGVRRLMWSSVVL